MNKGYVYRLISKDISIVECYIGSTKNMTERKRVHKSICNNSNDKGYNFSVYSFIRANGGFCAWDMVLVEIVMYNEKLELHQRERHHIEQYKSTLNTQIPARTQDENKENMKQYYNNHKDDIRANDKKYKNNHKDDIKIKQNDCICGGKFTQTNKSQHLKTIRHMKYIQNNNQISQIINV